jgi:xanthine/CO dehydrogenase XdhC/CoxF family maturation factor
VKHWQETARILDRVAQLGQHGQPAALATVVRVEGSAYRRAGAKLLIEQDGPVLGGVSGGCLEEDVRQVGLQVLRGGRSRLLHYNTSDDGAPVWGLGLGCDGQVDVFVQPVLPEKARGPWAVARELLEGDQPFALATRVDERATPEGPLVLSESGRVEAGPTEAPELEDAARAALLARGARGEYAWSGRVFTEVLLPPPKLLICGAGEDARPLITLAAGVGFRVSVADHRPAFLDAQRLPEARRLLLLRPEEDSLELPSGRDTYAVVMSHSLRHDMAWVRRLTQSDVAYVGILGPRGRTRRILAELGIEADPRVFGPVGLDLGAEGPEQIAVSIVAELLAVRARLEPHHLRAREVAVHARS